MIKKIKNQQRKIKYIYKEEITDSNNQHYGKGQHIEYEYKESEQQEEGKEEDQEGEGEGEIENQIHECRS